MFTSYLIPAIWAMSCALAAPVQKRQALGVIFGPITIPVGVSNNNITLINFADEVFDISSISVFGDINDGGCEEAEEGTTVAERQGQTVVLGPTDLPWSRTQVSNAQITLINFGDEVFGISSISVFGDINDGTCAPAEPAPSA